MVPSASKRWRPPVRAIRTAAEPNVLNYPYGPLVRLLLLTGQRVSEAAGARWSEIDLDLARDYPEFTYEGSKTAYRAAGAECSGATQKPTPVCRE